MINQFKQFTNLVNILYYAYDINSNRIDLLEKDFIYFCKMYNIEYNHKLIFQLIDLIINEKLTEKEVRTIYNKLILKNKILHILK